MYDTVQRYSASNASVPKLSRYNNEFLITRISSDRKKKKKKKRKKEELLSPCSSFCVSLLLAVSLSASFLDIPAEYANGILKRQLDFSMDFIVND